VSPSSSATAAPSTTATTPTTPPLNAFVLDNFADLSGWSSPYNGSGAYSQQGVRLKGNTQVDNGMLTVSARPVTSTTVVGTKTLSPGDFAAGGIIHRARLYPGTRIALDLRMSRSVGTRAAALLWPEGPWPAAGELDFVENGADLADRQSTAITNHWYDASASNKQGNAQQVIKYGPHDFTTWSHVEVLWQAHLFVVTIDGVEAARYTDHIPQGPMHLAIQTAVAGGGQDPSYKGASRTPGNVQVRGLRIYPA
jgi:hypothetical protein